MVPYDFPLFCLKSTFQEEYLCAGLGLPVLDCHLVLYTTLMGRRLAFNLDLTDPIEPLLPDDSAWRGTAGQYVVNLGPTSGCESGRNTSLPTLSASINAFTRLWLGVRPASGLAVTDDLAGPGDLVAELDWAFRLPRPTTDWNF